MPEHPTVTLSEIAQLAGGVTMPAVANWRKRFADFPQPIEKQGGVQLYDREAVIAWLTAHHRLAPTDESTRTAALEVADIFRGVDPLAMLDVIAHHADPESVDIPLDQARLLAKYHSIVEALGESPVIEAILDRVPRAAGRQLAEFATPNTLLTLFQTISDTPDNAVIYDPCVGFGSALAAIATPSSAPYGQEIQTEIAAIAQHRMNLRGLTSTIATGNTIERDLLPHVLADRVVAAPPINLELGDSVNPQDPRWIIDVPGRRQSDLAFVQIVLAHLNSTGRAIIHLALNTLTGGGIALREHLVRNNLLDAVITLPSGYFGATSIPSCLLVLDRNRPPATAQAQTPILLVDLQKTSDHTARPTSSDPVGIETFQQLWRGWEHRPLSEPFACTVTLLDVATNDFNLNPARYLTTIDWPRKPVTGDNGPTDPIAEELRAIDHELSGISGNLGLTETALTTTVTTATRETLRSLQQRRQLTLIRFADRNAPIDDVGAITPKDIADQTPAWLIEADDKQDDDDDFVARRGDILIVTRTSRDSRKQSVGRVTPQWHGRPIHPDIVILRTLRHGRRSLTADYLYFWLMSPVFSHHIETRASAGSIVRSVTTRDLLAFELPVCDLDTQQHLTSTFATAHAETLAAKRQLQHAVELLQRRSELLAEHTAARVNFAAD